MVPRHYRAVRATLLPHGKATTPHPSHLLIRRVHNVLSLLPGSRTMSSRPTLTTNTIATATRHHRRHRRNHNNRIPRLPGGRRHESISPLRHKGPPHVPIIMTLLRITGPRILIIWWSRTTARIALRAEGAPRRTAPQREGVDRSGDPTATAAPPHVGKKRNKTRLPIDPDDRPAATMRKTRLNGRNDILLPLRRSRAASAVVNVESLVRMNMMTMKEEEVF